MKMQQHEALELQLQERIAELEQENATLKAEFAQLRQTEAALRLSERRFRTIFEQAPIGIQILLRDGKIQANSAVYQIFGLPPDLFNYYNILEDQQLVDLGIMPLLQQAFAGEIVTFPPTFYDPGKSMPPELSEHEGCKTWTQGILYPIKDEQGRFDEIVLMHVDVSALKAAEAAILKEQERAAEERLAELAKANDALKQTVDVLATDPDLDRFLGHVLKVIALAFDAPLTEYWIDPEPGNTAYLGLSCWQGQILTPSEQPGHPGVVGVQVPPELIYVESLQHRKRHFLIDDLRTDPLHTKISSQIGVDCGAWYAARGVCREINVPLVLGEKSIGSLLVFLPAERHFSATQIELAYALAQQVTLAIQLTQLAEQAKLAAIASEQEKAAFERATELERINAELQQALNQLAESEARFRTLFELSSEGFHYVEFDPPYPVTLPIEEQCLLYCRNINVVQVNPAFAAMYGVDNPDSLVNLKIADVHVANSEKNASFVRAIVENGYRGRNIETEEIDRQGQVRYFLNSGVLTVKDEYVVSGWGTQIDITQLRQTQQALLQAEQERADELAKANEELRQRDHLLSVVAQVTKDLLEAEDADAAIPVALRAVGEVANMSRVLLILERLERSTKRLKHCVAYEWVAEGIFEHHSVGMSVMDNDDFQVLIQPLYKGQSVWHIIDDLPNATRSQFDLLKIKSTGVVPIFIEGHYIGCVGFDDCVTPRRPSQQEIDVLTAAADNIGAALYRKQLVRLIEERARAAEERAAELEQVNANLRQALDRLAESEERYRTLFELSSEGIYRWELDHPIPVTLPVEQQIDLLYRSVYVAEANVAYAAMYGLAQTEDILGLRLKDVHASSNQNLAFVRTLVENKYRIRDAESEEIDSKGRRCYLNNGIGIIEDGCLVGGWATQVDITELRMAQEALIAERIRAEQERAAELAKANEALKQSLDVLATEPDLDKFLGQVLGAIALQFQSDLTEYWYHPEGDICYVGMMSWQKRIYQREEITRLYPEHPGINGILVTPEMIHGEVLQHRKRYFIVEHETSLFTKNVFWYRAKGLYKEINIPMTLGDDCIGALVIRLPRDRSFTTQQLELAQALAHQATLAVKLTELAEESRQAAILKEQEKAAQERAAELEKINTALSRSLHELANKKDIGHFLKDLLVVLSQNVGASHAMLFTVNKDAKTASIIAAVKNGVPYIDGESADPYPEVSCAPANIELVVENFYRTRAIWFLNTSELDEAPISEVIAWHRRQGHCEAAAAPLFAGEDLIGLLGFAFEQKSDLSPFEIEFIKSLAAQATLALQLIILAEEAKQAAIAREQEKAAQQRAAELAKANDALKQSLDVLASEPDLDKFLGQLLGAIANQFQSPLTEYWYHPESDMAYLGMISWQGRILNREEISKAFPTHPGFNGFRVPPELRNGESLQRYNQCLIYEDHSTNPLTQHLDLVANWIVPQGLVKEFNVPMTLGEETIGRVVIRLPRDRSFTTQQIELAQALTHQATLAVKLTQFAEESRQATLLEERNRMAQEIHDTLAQAFTGILMQLQAATRFLATKPEQTKACITRAQDLAREGLAEARRSVWYLRQDDTECYDLLHILTRIAEQLTAGTSVQAEVCAQGKPYSLNAEVGMNLLRIAQESLTNALRHAQAQMIHISLSYESDRIQLRVRDDGQGFNLQQQISSGFGLKGMQQRCDRIGAQLEINSKPKAGTEITVVVLLTN